jgi:hypothetical protein
MQSVGNWHFSGLTGGLTMSVLGGEADLTLVRPDVRV